ncbi:MAG TPA: hypothetical protein VEX86_11935 [Longimicrobium sp.]|nr:hypothetical protein [Longimicrobium sp.]
MRKLIIPAAALLFCATPAAAQQVQASQDAAPLSAAQTDAPKAAQEPSLYPSTEQVKADVQQNEERLGQREQVGNRQWWYLVAAIAVGVIVAALVL